MDLDTDTRERARVGALASVSVHVHYAGCFRCGLAEWEMPAWLGTEMSNLEPQGGVEGRKLLSLCSGGNEQAGQANGGWGAESGGSPYLDKGWQVWVGSCRDAERGAEGRQEGRPGWYGPQTVGRGGGVSLEEASEGMSMGGAALRSPQIWNRAGKAGGELLHRAGVLWGLWTIRWVWVPECTGLMALKGYHGSGAGGKV